MNHILTVAHFKKEKRLEIRDNFDNVLRNIRYTDYETAKNSVLYWIDGYTRGWTAAATSIGTISAASKWLEVDDLDWSEAGKLDERRA